MKLYDNKSLWKSNHSLLQVTIETKRIKTTFIMDLRLSILMNNYLFNIYNQTTKLYILINVNIN